MDTMWIKLTVVPTDEWNQKLNDQEHSEVFMFGNGGVIHFKEDNGCTLLLTNDGLLDVFVKEDVNAIFDLIAEFRGTNE